MVHMIEYGHYCPLWSIIYGPNYQNSLFNSICPYDPYDGSKVIEFMLMVRMVHNVQKNQIGPNYGPELPSRTNISYFQCPDQAMLYRWNHPKYWWLPVLKDHHQKPTFL